MGPKQYLKKKNVSVTQAALDLKWSRQWLSTLLNRDEPWPLDKAKEFSEYAHNAVTIMELLRVEQP